MQLRHGSVTGFALSFVLTATMCGQKPVASAGPAARGYVGSDGSVRIIGGAATKGVTEKLDALFSAKHPELNMHFVPANDAAAIDSLIFDAAFVAPVSSVYGGGIAYSDIVKAPPFAIRIAHASLDPAALASPLAVIVNPANTVAALSMDQLASMFAKPLRAPSFSKWSQVGVQISDGDLIAPAGLPWTDHYPSEDEVFGEDTFFRRFGGAPPADRYRAFATYAEVQQFVAREPTAIGIVPANRVGTGVRVLGLMDGSAEKVRTPSATDIRSGHYPLDRYLYLYARVVKGKQLDPLISEYLQLALSPEGQQAIAEEGEGFIPLNATEVGEEKAKLE